MWIHTRGSRLLHHFLPPQEEFHKSDTTRFQPRMFNGSEVTTATTSSGSPHPNGSFRDQRRGAFVLMLCRDIEASKYLGAPTHSARQHEWTARCRSTVPELCWSTTSKQTTKASRFHRRFMSCRFVKSR